VRIVSTDDLATVGATNYLLDQQSEIYLINGGLFQYSITDVVLVYASDGWGLYTITPDFYSLTLLITSNTTGFANAPVNTNIIQMTGLTSTIAQPTGIADTSGNLVLGFNYIGSSVNYLTLHNAVTTNFPGITISGTDTNIGMLVDAKGSGYLLFRSPTGSNFLQFVPNSGSNSFRGIFDLPTITANRTYTFQDASGTVAFTSDITAVSDFVEVTGTTQTIAANTRYFANNVALVTFTIPATFPKGKTFQVSGYGAGGWQIQQSVAGHKIHFESTDSTLGATGFLASTNRYDSVTLVCTVVDSEFVVFDSVGNLLVFAAHQP